MAASFTAGEVMDMAGEIARLGGRPRSYDTVEQFDAAVNAYFNSISRTVTMLDTITGRPVLDELNNPVCTIHWYEPPTVTALCIRLGISAQTWHDYGNQAGFSETISRARQIIQSWNERELLTRPGADTRGIIFNLQNNFGYSEKKEVEIGPGATKAVMSLADKRDRLRALRAELLDGED